MCRVVLTLSALLLPWGLAFSQPQAPPAAPPGGDQRLDAYLQKWEREMANVQTLAAQLNRVEKDPVFKSTQKYTGYAQYMKVRSGSRTDNLATLEMRPEGKPEIAEKIVITGAYLYQFQPARKEIQAIALPQPQVGGVSDDNLMSLLFGVKAAEARRRYELKLTNEDQYYIYVSITPRNQQDKADFQRARLVLNKDTFLPRQLWFEQPNGGEVTWDIPAIKSGVQLRREDFDAPKPPPDWKMLQVQRNSDMPPKMIRGGQP